MIYSQRPRERQQLVQVALLWVEGRIVIDFPMVLIMAVSAAVEEYPVRQKYLPHQ